MAYILHKCEEYKVIESIQYDSINSSKCINIQCLQTHISIMYITFDLITNSCIREAVKWLLLSKKLKEMLFTG